MLNELSVELDNIFNFSILLLENNILPPVLIEGEKSINLIDQNSCALLIILTHIYSPAAFISVPPSWRSYLIKEEEHFKTRAVTNLVADLLPQSSEEQLIWGSSC